jgi:predicted phosphodiesterase
VELPDDVRRYLVISDVHVPYHDPESLAVAMDYARAKATRCDGVLINGDLIDFYQLSRFERDPRNRRVPEELESVGQVLDAIHVHLKPRRVVWKLGNHEKRWARYMRERAPELLGIPAFELASVLETEARGIMVVDANHVLKHRALYIMHGHELGGGGQSPVGPARTALLKATDCALIGHHHRTDQHSGNTIGGVTLTSWALGCLCDLHPEYAIVNRWCHGFATLDVGSDWKVDNKRIINGMVY